MKKLFLSMMAIAIAACTFTSCEDVPEPYNNPYQNMGTKVTVEPTGDGTLASPFNVAAALAKCEEVGEDGTATEVYATGYVTELTEVSASYGNATFKIADSKEGGDALTVYRAKGFNGENITDENILHTGDSVVICGKLVNFKGNTPEFTQGCYIVSINGQGGGDTPNPETVGTKESPKNVADALAAINALENGATTAEKWYIKGKVKTIKSTDANITQYKNLDYTIVDEGQTNELTVFRGKYLENTDFTTENKLKEGDEVIILGNLQKFVKNDAVTPEVTGSYVVVLNGTGGGGSDTPTGDNLLSNGGFETWADGVPTNWKSTTSASSSGYPTQSTTAHSGTYSAELKVDANNNRRMAYKEITLKAGTYKIKFYAKGAEEAGTSINPGYVVVVDGKVSGSYQYGGYVNDIKDWQEVTSSFTLSAQTTINLVVMIPKNAKSNALIDDFELTTSDGGIVTDGGSDTNPNTTPSDLGTADSPITVAKALEAINALADGASTETEAYVKGKISQIKGYYNNKQITYWISDDGSTTNELQIYNGLDIDGAAFTSKDDLTVGQTVVVKGKLMKYVKNSTTTPEINGGILVSK